MFHHVEHMNGVNHRYYKAVNGKILIGRNYKNKTFHSLVRFHSLKSSKAEYKIEGILKKKKLLLEKIEMDFIHLELTQAIYINAL